jgi:hypothetical protein
MRFVFLVLLLLPICALPQGRVKRDNRWLPIAASELEAFALDTQTIKSTPEGYLAVWLRVTANGSIDDFRTNHINDRKKHNLDVTGYERYGETRELYVIDCINGRSAVREMIDYKTDGRQLDRSPQLDRAPHDTIPDSVGEGVVAQVCSYAQRRRL